MSTPIPKHILPIIVIAQFCGTSIWFAGNAVLSNLPPDWNISDDQLGSVTSSVQLGFIVGTLVFAFFALSDRFSARKIFLFCAAFGAISNAAIVPLGNGLFSVLVFRFISGFFLAGIYPIGMKIAAGWFQGQLGKAIGYLVGALVLGTAFPHLLKSIGQIVAWDSLLIIVSALALSGGILIYFLVPDGPHSKKGTPFDPKALSMIFKVKSFRAAAFGYFGHMWELYAFWAFVPVLVALKWPQESDPTHASYSFYIIAAGAIGCIAGGYLSLRRGSARTAYLQLFMSGLCCLLFPFVFDLTPTVFFIFMLIWGIFVVGDSPQFSTITAKTAPEGFVGSGLTIVNSFGFALTVVSIQAINLLADYYPLQQVMPVLALGPLLGLAALKPLLKSKF